MPSVPSLQDRLNSLTKQFTAAFTALVFGEVQKRLNQAVAGIKPPTLQAAPKPAAPAAKKPQAKAPAKKAASAKKPAPQKAKSKGKPATKKPITIKRDMTCRVEDCKAPHRGPKYQFFCNEHYLSLSAEEKDTITKAYMARKSGKGATQPATTAAPAAPAVEPTQPAPSEPVTAG